MSLGDETDRGGGGGVIWSATGRRWSACKNKSPYTHIPRCRHDLELYTTKTVRIQVQAPQVLYPKISTRRKINHALGCFEDVPRKCQVLAPAGRTHVSRPIIIRDAVSTHFALRSDVPWSFFFLFSCPPRHRATPLCSSPALAPSLSCDAIAGAGAGAGLFFLVMLLLVMVLVFFRDDGCPRLHWCPETPPTFFPA